MHCVACLVFAVLAQVVLANAAKGFNRSLAHKVRGQNHVYGTNCPASVSLFVGENATFYCNNVSITLVCDVDGKQTSSSLWLFNGKKIEKDLQHLGSLIMNNSLLLRNISVQSGLYTCNTSSEVWTKSASSMIRYIGPQKPKIFYDLKTEVFMENFKIFPVRIGNNVTVFGKSLLMLFCNASGVPRPRIEWSRENGKIERKYLKQDNLLLPRNAELSGKYVCKASNFAGETQIASNILFQEPILPTILASKKKLKVIDGENGYALNVGEDITTLAGTDISIECQASGIPHPKITWYHNGQVWPGVYWKNGLLFNKQAIQPYDSGNYTCVASNAFGSASMTSAVHVIEPVIPYINASSDDVESYDMSFPITKIIGGSLKTLVGASFLLLCYADGIPNPKVTWKKDNLPIRSTKRIKVSGNKVEVLGAMMSDTGWYSCIASNGAGSDRRSTFVQLRAPVKPQIRKTPYTQRFIVNNNPTPLNIGVGIELRILAYRELAIYCIAKGFPPPVILWEKNGYPIESNDDIRIEKEGRKLLFPRLVPSQSGKYTCVASNAAGQDRKRTILRARLPYKPSIKLQKLVLSKYQLSPQRGNVRVYEIPEEQTHLVVGADVTLECIAKRGYPRAKFKWFKNGKPIKGKTLETFNKSKLELLNVQKVNEGVYKCLARNFLGKHEKTIELKLKDRNRLQAQK